MPFLTRPHCALYYEVHGDLTGPRTPLVLAHGLGGNHLSWWQQLAHFAPSRACVVFSHRGFALSPEAPGGPGLAGFADDLLALLDHLELHAPILVGQSMGGWTCTSHAAAHPDRLRAVEAGQDVYARYGDDAASPRLATVLRRERGKQTGSRTGFTGSLKILVPGPGGEMLQIDGSDYYDKRYWDPREYRAWHDSVWTKPRTGRVDVGDVVQVEDSPTSRIPASAPATDTPEPQSPEPDDGNLGTRPQP